MFTLRGRQDGFRLLLPKDFLCPEIEEKYTKILKEKHSFFTTPIDFVNETIQKVEVLGFINGTIQQQQSYRGEQPLIKPNRIKQNDFMYPSGDYSYRSEVSPISLMDKTINITFRHTIGFLNYFLLFENFWYLFSRDRNYDEITDQFNVDIINEKGSIYSRIILYHPLMNGMDMLSLDYTQPVAQMQSFNIEFKYSNFDFEFINIEDDNIRS